MQLIEPDDGAPEVRAVFDCIASHTASARAKGMTGEQLGERLAVVGMANETNALATGFGVQRRSVGVFAGTPR